MEKRIPKATYVFELPFLLCGKEYFNSADLTMALIQHWDIGLMAAKRGELAAFFDYHAEENPAFQNIAEASKAFFIDLHSGKSKMQDVGEDLEYSRYLCKLEENIPGIPVIRYGQTAGEIMGKEEWMTWRKTFFVKQLGRPDVADERQWNAWIWTAYWKSELLERINER
ncbi:MAG: hypothetical protein IJ353_04065 [Lachnospiraceae bacterium]|nr:hypothetical protein [Lachnospiraceae bacterium]